MKEDLILNVYDNEKVTQKNIGDLRESVVCSTVGYEIVLREKLVTMCY